VIRHTVQLKISLKKLEVTATSWGPELSKFLKICTFFIDTNADPGRGSGIFLTLDPESVINIPDPQHWKLV
jgi:hypothetical protein